MSKEENQIDMNFWTKIKRRLARFFLSQGSCSGSCNDCAVCPIIDKEKYTFEIKKRV
jgi:hypothetical protein